MPEWAHFRQPRRGTPDHREPENRLQHGVTTHPPWRPPRPASPELRKDPARQALAQPGQRKKQERIPRLNGQHKGGVSDDGAFPGSGKIAHVLKNSDHVMSLPCARHCPPNRRVRSDHSGLRRSDPMRKNSQQNAPKVRIRSRKLGCSCVSCDEDDSSRLLGLMAGDANPWASEGLACSGACDATKKRC